MRWADWTAGDVESMPRSIRLQAASMDIALRRRRCGRCGSSTSNLSDDNLGAWGTVRPLDAEPTISFFHSRCDLDGGLPRAPYTV